MKEFGEEKVNKANRVFVTSSHPGRFRVRFGLLVAQANGAKSSRKTMLLGQCGEFRTKPVLVQPENEGWRTSQRMPSKGERNQEQACFARECFLIRKLSFTRNPSHVFGVEQSVLPANAEFWVTKSLRMWCSAPRQRWKLRGGRS